MSTQLQIRGLRVELGGRTIIENLSFTAPTGSFIVLMGASGSGKSTLLRALAGLNPCTAEELRLGSTDLRPLPPAKRGVAMVFQDHALFPHLSVEQNLVFGLRARGVGATESAARAKRVAAELGISALLPRRVPGLSGGERQRVALGRALLREAPLVLMDEPLSSLDAPLRAKMRQDILRLHRQRGWTTVYVTHDPVEALAMADWLGLI
ncbi:MAG: ABC transporter ATP-binding protein, partial [Oceanococcaceae bacterium]